MSVIKELWHGNIIPQEDSRTNSKEMKKMDAFTPTLNCLSRQITLLENTDAFTLILSKNIAKADIPHLFRNAV